MARGVYSLLFYLAMPLVWLRLVWRARRQPERYFGEFSKTPFGKAFAAPAVHPEFVAPHEESVCSGPGIDFRRRPIKTIITKQPRHQLGRTICKRRM